MPIWLKCQKACLSVWRVFESATYCNHVASVSEGQLLDEWMTSYLNAQVDQLVPWRAELRAE